MEAADHFPRPFVQGRKHHQKRQHRHADQHTYTVGDRMGQLFAGGIVDIFFQVSYRKPALLN